MSLPGSSKRGRVCPGLFKGHEFARVFLKGTSSDRICRRPKLSPPLKKGGRGDLPLPEHAITSNCHRRSRCRSRPPQFLPLRAPLLPVQAIVSFSRKTKHPLAALSTHPNAAHRSQYSVSPIRDAYHANPTTQAGKQRPARKPKAAPPANYRSDRAAGPFTHLKPCRLSH